MVEGSSVQFLGHAKCSDQRLSLSSSRSAEKIERDQSVEADDSFFLQAKK